MPRSRWYFWDGGFLAAGYSTGVVPPHTHHAIQMAVVADGVARLRTEDGDWREYAAAAVQSDVAHSLETSGTLGGLLLIDPESREGRWLQSCLKEPISSMLPERIEAARVALRKFWEQPPDAAGTADFVSFLVRQFGTGMMPMHTIDARVAKVIEHIQQMDSRVVSLDKVAGLVFLSPSRFAHLFTDEVGIPFRRYLLWRRLTRAMVLVSRGATLSRAAHGAGFSDSAHFTRTFYQMFGIPPSAMLNQGEMYEIPAPFELARTT
jgi:AraC-like DNA-binding protein